MTLPGGRAKLASRASSIPKARSDTSGVEASASTLDAAVSVTDNATLPRPSRQ